MGHKDPKMTQGGLKVFADTPLRPALIQIGEAFRRDTGQQVDFVFDSSPVILKKLADGEAADVLIVHGHCRLSRAPWRPVGTCF